MSLKGEISSTELLDTIEAVQKGDEDAKRRLDALARKGIVSSEVYNNAIKRYNETRHNKKVLLSCALILILFFVCILDVFAHSGMTGSNNGNGYSDEYGIEYDYGYEDGYDIGYENGHGEGYNDGYYDGHTHGYDKGYEVGYNYRIEEASENNKKEFEIFSRCSIAICLIYATVKLVKRK